MKPDVMEARRVEVVEVVVVVGGVSGCKASNQLTMFILFVCCGMPVATTALAGRV